MVLDFTVFMLKYCNPFAAQCLLVKPLKKKLFENIVGEEENAGKQHFLLLPQGFLLNQRKIADFIHIEIVYK